MRENAAKQGLNSEGGKNVCGEPRTVDFLGSSSSQKLIAGGDDPPMDRKRCRVRVSADLAGRNRKVRAPQMISQQNQAIRIINGSGRSRTPSTREKIAVVAPMPRAK